MPISISITADDKIFKRKINTFNKSVKNLTVPLIKASNVILKETEKQFNTEGSHLGTKWVKRKDNFPWKILQRTNTMKNAFAWRPVKPKNQVTIYNKLEKSYYKYHQSNRPRTKLPRRQMLVVNKRIIDLVVKEFNDYFSNQVKKI